MELLKVENLHAGIEDKKIIKGLDLVINKGEVHVIMGPNGAGKSTLASILIGHPKYEVSQGKIVLEGEEIQESLVDERARKGIFLSFQYPEEIPGLTVEDFLRSAKEAVSGEKQYILRFNRLLKEKMAQLKMDESYANRYLNVGFSGGEKKKNEILQMAILEPKLAILDETDSGLDRDATKIVFEGVKTLKSTDKSMLIITHYNKVLEYLEPDFVHILMDGRIVKTGGKELVEFIETHGYEKLRKEFLGDN
ncbi:MULTISPECIES: Fe-S cluster assembly ATPase SufC [Streptobacillus]|uniref:FeS assembly ATPase SufC n=1 Tax=Streptobacillus moniliformis (strain ATCC 14647 / DSM 12112 / NCTC 10651 / 9901) TaxID=519441 RepID=D1AV39_STRM9|nr:MULTISPECIES: Fe-S cluster assembly ATPase SufC [Streptobacillus]ACZ01599.1 FeS assembly ATPase SufC [Streptobacillus moniliformis DSM 12112]AVL43403.1 Fe-S cluster assembly ATPase SufC [Streptobacillus moniliformis]QXW66274.1 Fe-S cluster assembly ATPase SufC [Streptobacillus moniliformis]SQA13228.1 Vegetative protein 296 [Streptobacillus moniliformis]